MCSRRHRPLIAGLAVAVIAAAGLTAAHHPTRLAVPARVAISAALHDPQTRGSLAGSHWTSATVSPLDAQTERVAFYSGAQLVVEVQVGTGAHVLTGVNVQKLPVPYGNYVAYEPALLILMGALFVLMAGVTPWRRLRNLDVAASLLLAMSVVLFQHRYVSASLICSAAGMLYLLTRCAWTALGTPRTASRSTPLLTAITPGLDPARRVRWLRWLLVAVALMCAMIGLGSTDPVDVIYAVMEGATRMTHGVLPYGHLPPGIFHGDTYPILSYALYVPFALLMPVNNVWDPVEVGLFVAVIAALVSAWAVFRLAAGRRSPRAPGRSPEAEEAGLRAAVISLAFAPALITVSTGTTDVVLAAMLAIAVLAWRRPAWCAGLLSLAGWFKLAPFVLLPVVLAPHRGRRLALPLAVVALVSVLPIGLLLALGGAHGVSEMLHAIAYQFSRGSYQSVWGALGIPGLQPAGQACVLGLITGAVIKLRREPDLARDRARMAALTAAILLGLQLAADYWAFLYLIWVTPLIGYSVLARPAVAEEAVESPVAVPARLQAAGALAG